MKTRRFYKRVVFVYEQKHSEFIFNYLNKKFGHKEVGYEVEVIKEDDLRSCVLNIRNDKFNEVKYLCDMVGITCG